MALYDYQYDIAAIIILTALFFIYMLKPGIKTKSNRIFLILMGFDFVAAWVDVFSTLGLSFPDKYPVLLTQLCTYGYLFFYNMLSVLFFEYVDSKAKVNKARKPANIIGLVITLYYFIGAMTTHWTHLFSYVDSNGVYGHGPLMITLYIIAGILFVLEAVLIVQGRKNFNKYQFMACITFLVIMTTSVIVQFVYARALIGQLVMGMILVFVYSAFENPAYYNFGQTSCFNRTAFRQNIYYRPQKKGDFNIVGFEIQDYEYYRRGAGTRTVRELSDAIAEHINRTYGKNAFILHEDRFAIIVEEKGDIEPTVDELTEYFSKPIKLVDAEMQVSALIVPIVDITPKFSTEDVEGLVEYRLSNPDDRMPTASIIENALKVEHNRASLLHIIKRAIANDEFKVFIQPIRSVETGRYESAEALLRLIDPEIGFINPEELVTTAEENGYIDEIGEIIFRKVCQFISESGVCEKGLLKYIEVNVSPKQCTKKSFAAGFINIMKEYKIEPSWINLEITETAHMAHEDVLFSNIDKLSKYGVGFSIDDYGSGFASADYLIKLPVSIVKIDKMILWQAMENKSAMTVLVRTMALIKELGYHIVVEGVETEEMAALLRENGCDYMQGYLYSKPLPMSEYEKFLIDNNN